MNLLKLLLRTSRGLFLAAALAGIGGGASSTLALAAVSRALHTQPRTLALGLEFALACLLLLGFRTAAQLLVARLSQDALLAMRARLARRVVSAPLRQLEELGAHRLLAGLTDDVLTLSEALPGIPAICTDVAIVVGCLGYMAYLSLPLFGVSMLILLFGLMTFSLPARLSARALRRARADMDALYGLYRGLTEGVKELKLHRERRDAFLDEALYPTADSFRRHSIRSMTVWAVGASWGQTLFLAGMGFLLFAGPSFTAISEPALTAYVLVVLYLATPLEFIIALLPMMGRAEVALENLEKLGLSLEAEPAATASAIPGPFRRLELEGVTHAYRRESEERRFVLGPISLSLSAGELVFLAGGNGSGKTTLAKLLCGLYTPEAGQIRVDGQAIDDSNRESYRQLFSGLFADSWLFERLYGLKGDPDGLLEQLELSNKVKIENGTFSTTQLSQGQRRRLLLLAAVMENRPIYIFDEWASDQDPVFREVFYTRILPDLKQRGKAVFVISHDDRYFHVADRLLRLDYGKLRDGERAERQAR